MIENERSENMMNEEKKAVPGGKRMALPIIAAAFLLLSFLSVSVFALLKDTTSVVTNTFQRATVTCSVNETMNLQTMTKSNVSVTNTGNIPAYIRAKVVVNWVNEDGDVVPPPGGDYSYTLNYATGTDWVSFGSDGYYYFTEPVAPSGTTETLISSVALGASYPAEPKYFLQVVILADAVQAAPPEAMAEAWGVGINNGSVSAAAVSP